jgi:Uma2 family endonuclease
MTLLTDKPASPPLDLTTADPDELRQYAIELAGRPVPGVRMTADEFEAWAIDHADAEWVNGRIILMSPANDFHEERDEWLGRVMGDWIEQHESGTLRRNMTVRLSGAIRRVPDILFISSANRHIIKPTCIDGPPDLVIEIISPDSQDHDRREKFQEYQAGGVPEYWIVDPLSKRLDAFRLKEDSYELFPPVEDRIEAAALPGLYVRPSWLFGEKLPKVRDCLTEIEGAMQKPAQPDQAGSA